jgi:hypothetical protein
MCQPRLVGSDTGRGVRSCSKRGHRPRIDKISLLAIFYLMRVEPITILLLVMILACAEPDKGWGRRPCEGEMPSISTCVSGWAVAARRAHPGPGAAWKGSNVADRIPRSNGGQRCCWPEPRRSSNARKERSSPAAASRATISTTVHLDCRRSHLSGLGPGVVLVGVTDDPFTALGREDG